MKTLDEARAYAKQEKSRDTCEIWEAILAAHDALVAIGSPGLPERYVSIARSNLVRAGSVESGSFTDDDLTAMATADGVRVWEADMGMIFKDEPVIGPDQELYICQQQHQAQAGWAPGSEGGRTLFRLLRKEPEEPGTYLEFAWGEHVPYGAVRRDPSTGNSIPPSRRRASLSTSPIIRTLFPRSTSSMRTAKKFPSRSRSRSLNPSRAALLTGTISKQIIRLLLEITSPTTARSTKSSAPSPSWITGPRPPFSTTTTRRCKEGSQ